MGTNQSLSPCASLIIRQMMMRAGNSDLTNFGWSARLAMTVMIIELLHGLEFLIHGPQTHVKVIVA